MKKALKHLVCLFLLLILAVPCILKTDPVQAAGNPRLVTLKPGVTYTKYDANSNISPNKIRVNVKKANSYIQSASITVSGITVFSIKTQPGCITDFNVQLCTLSNHKVYFFVEGIGDSVTETFAGIYEVRGRKLQRVVNMRSLLDNNYSYKFSSCVKSVSGNTITFRYMDQNWTLGAIDFELPLQYKNGKLILPTHTFYTKYPPKYAYAKKNTWTAARSFTTYTNANQTKKSFTVKKNEVVRIDKIYIKSKVLYVRVTKKDGKTGWFKGLKGNKGSGYLFKEAILAG